MGIPQSRHAASGGQPGKVRFASFEVDLNAGELRRYGAKIRLQAQPFQILSALLERPGEIVTREDLCERIWGKVVFVDFDHSLAAAVKRLRDSLCDSAAAPRYIETVGRRGSAVAGYRFVGRIASGSKTQARLTLAVLPFSTRASGIDPFFLEGLTEEINTRMARLAPQRLAVIARASTLACAQFDNPLQEVRSRLSAAYVLEGTVRKSGDRCRITVQLIDAYSHTLAWGHTYDRSLEELNDWLVLEGDLAHRVVSAVAASLFPDENIQYPAVEWPHSKAYEAYLRGRYHWTRSSEQGFHLTNKYYLDAIELDPSFAPPYAGLADSYNIYSLYASGLNSDIALPASAEIARQYASKAVELNPDLAEGHAAMAFSLMQHDWKWTAAENTYKQAIRLSPNSVYAHHWYGWALVQAGQFDACVEQMEIAKALDPLCPAMNANYGWFLYLMRRNEQAIPQLEATLELRDPYPMSIHALALAYHAAGRYAESICLLEKCIPEAVAHPITLSSMVCVQMSAGNPEAAFEVLHRMESMAETRIVSPYFLARAYAGVGDHGRAFECLERAIDERSAWIPHLDVEPMFDSLRSDARWARTLRLRDQPRPLGVAA